MQHLSTLTQYTLLGFVATAIWAPLLIDALYRLNIVVRHRLMRNKMNEEFIKIQGHKSGTPTMGGLMIAITVALVTIVLVPASDLRDVFLIGWGLFTLYGTADGLLVFTRKVSDKFRLLQESFVWRLGKLGLLFLIALFVTWLLNSQLGISSLTLIPGLELSFGWGGMLLFSFGTILALYGMEITDGADGLVTGQFLVALSAYAVIAAASGKSELLPLLGLALGSSLLYLYFNINPARVFMGGSGTLPIGFLLLLAAVVTNTLPVFVIMGIVFWIELFSSTSQILSIRFLGRKIFRIAPIHHHFEAVGWPEAKVVQRFWLASALAALVALWVFTLL